jgi:hypothetical protein
MLLTKRITARKPSQPKRDEERNPLQPKLQGTANNSTAAKPKKSIDAQQR